MALDRLLGRVVDFAFSLASTPTKPAAPPVEAEPLPWQAPEASKDAPDAEEATILSADEARAAIADEPFPTRTMAQILSAQGEKRRALAIYRALVAKDPDDADLAAEMRAVAKALETSPPPAPRPSEDTVTADQEVVAVRVDKTSVLVSWEVSDAGIERAKRLLPDARGLAARLVVVAPDPEEVVRTEAKQRGVERMGEWLVAGLPPGAYATAAVGLVDGERFVSIAHARVLAPAA
ncbi:MAG: hypothetical protein U0230_11580 [Polyangiales bacterium]